MIDCEFMSCICNEETAEVTKQNLEILKRHTTPMRQKVEETRLLTEGERINFNLRQM